MDSFFQLTQKPISEIYYPVDLVVCDRKSKLKHIIETMLEKNVGCIIVVENEIPIGIFTERDVLKKVVIKQLDLNSTQVDEVMTPNPVCLNIQAPLNQIMAAMRVGKFRHVILVNDEKILKGVVSIKDLLDQVIDFINEQKSLDLQQKNKA